MGSDSLVKLGRMHHLPMSCILAAECARRKSRGTSWWPAGPKGDLDVEKIHKEGFDLYVVERPADSVNIGVYLFALDWSKGRGFFHWTYE